MAAEEPQHIGIDDDVDFVTEQIGALHKLGERSEVDEEDVYDVSIRWGTALAGRLPRMAHFSSLGELSDADERRFQALCEELRTLAPLIERFNLARPDLMDWTDARTSGRHHPKKGATDRRRWLGG